MTLAGRVLICDIVTEDDLRRLSLALIAAGAAGRRFVYRVGPPFVRARIGQDQHLPLGPAEVVAACAACESPRRASSAGGVVVVGSHVGVTQRQLANLKQAFPAEVVEIEIARVVGEARNEEYLPGLVERAVEALQ